MSKIGKYAGFVIAAGVSAFVFFMLLKAAAPSVAKVAPGVATMMASV